MQVVATALARRPVEVDARGREDPLPGPLPAGVRILPAEGVGQLDPAGADGEVVAVLSPDRLEMAGQIGLGDAPAAS